jgi:membrane protein
VFSLGPIIVIAIAVAGLLFGHDAVTAQVMSSISEMLGDTGAKADAGRSQPPCRGHSRYYPRCWSASFRRHRVVVQLKDALNVVWEVDDSKNSGLWHFSRNYVLSFAAVLSLGFLLLVSLLVSAGLAAAGKYAGTHVPEAVLHVANMLISLGGRDGAVRHDVRVAAGRFRGLAG